MHQKHVKFEAYDCIVKLSCERFWFACRKLTHPSLLPYLQASWTVVLFNPFPNKPWFLRVCSTSLLKTLWEKEKSLVTSNFSFSHSVFNPFGELSPIFIKLKIVVCKLFEFGRV